MKFFEWHRNNGPARARYVLPKNRGENWKIMKKKKQTLTYQYYLLFIERQNKYVLNSWDWLGGRPKNHSHFYKYRISTFAPVCGVRWLIDIWIGWANREMWQGRKRQFDTINLSYIITATDYFIMLISVCRHVLQKVTASLVIWTSWIGLSFFAAIR